MRNIELKAPPVYTLIQFAAADVTAAGSAAVPSGVWSQPA